MNFIKKIVAAINNDECQKQIEPHFLNLFETMPLGVIYHDCTGKIISANPAAAKILGLTQDELMGRGARDPRWKAVHEDGTAFSVEEHPSMVVLKTGQAVSDIIMGVFNPAEKQQKWIRINAFPEFREGYEKPYLVFSTFDDITEMKKVEEKLTDQILRMRKAEQVAGFGSWGIRLNDDVVYASEGAREIYGLSGSEWPIREVQQLPLPEYRPLLDKAIMELITSNAPYDAKFKIRRPINGEIIDVHSIAGYDPEKFGVYGVIHDITKAVKAENDLKESERKLSTLMSNLPGIAYRCRNDKDWTMEFISDGCKALTGYDPEDFINNMTLSFNELIHPDHRQRLWDKWQTAISEKKYIQEEYPVILPTGEERWFWEKGCAVYSETGEVLALEGFIADLTDLKRSEKDRIDFERQLLQTQKLESLGVLAGGIAHDFNNILMAILGHADLALDELSPMSPARESISEIEKASRRAADLCRQMLAYSGKGRFIIEKIVLKDLVEEMVHLLKTSISKKARIDLHLEKNIPVINGDATQIRQVLMNLVINASEAIGEKEGTIKITTGTMDCSLEYLSDSCLNESNEGKHVWIEVSDTGCGMDYETISRIFEPFFTTKFTGRGLGMSAVIGIVRGHKGALKIFSESGKGTSFRILFSAAEADKAEKHVETRSDLSWQGGGTILLVDDEESIRSLGKAMLSRLGFETVTAADGREAVEIYAAQKENIHMVILDLTMPKMNGEETLKELMLINPDVKVIISSGYTEYEIASRFSGNALAGFIQKPYKMKSLNDCLQEALQAV